MCMRCRPSNSGVIRLSPVSMTRMHHSGGRGPMDRNNRMTARGSTATRLSTWQRPVAATRSQGPLADLLDADHRLHPASTKKLRADHPQRAPAFLDLIERVDRTVCRQLSSCASSPPVRNLKMGSAPPGSPSSAAAPSACRREQACPPAHLSAMVASPTVADQEPRRMRAPCRCRCTAPEHRERVALELAAVGARHRRVLMVTGASAAERIPARLS
jgi:hypothetical protein